MPLLRRHKYVLVMLSIYWVVLFIATHMPVPQMARQSGMSDKTMHFIAYLVLVFLWWFGVSPYEKVNWQKPKVWLSLGLIACYGGVDEWLQYYVNRNPNIADFGANMAGAIVGLAILSVFSFWSASLVISAIFIFSVTNLSAITIPSETTMLCPGPTINLTFHFLAYGFFTLIWIQWIYRRMSSKLSNRKWIVLAPALPLVLLAGVKLCSIPMGKKIWMIDCLAALAGVFTAILVSYLIGLTGKGTKTKTQG